MSSPFQPLRFSLVKNLTANFAGRIWMTLLSFLFIPLYIERLGIEAYGIVSFYTTFFTLFSLLDLGLGTTMNREMARMSSENGPAEEFRNLTRTLEWIYWPMGLFIGITIFSLSHFFATSWVNAHALSPITISRSICIMGVALALQWPLALYAGGLLGLQKQVLLNGITVATATLRGVGAILILTYISTTLEAFFLWQIIVNLFQTTLTAICLWKNLPKSASPPLFDKLIWHRIKHFAGGMTIIALLSQLDKVILSKCLPLELFGYYSLALMVANSLQYVSEPLFSSYFPKFSQLISSTTLKQTYHTGCQLMSVLLIPLALIGILFSEELLFLWTHNLETAKKTTLLVSLLMTGTLLNGLVTLPFALQLAHGWTSLAIYQNVIGALLLLLGVPYYGAVFAASLSIAMNVGYFLISIPIMHRKILIGEKTSWYIQDVGLPLLAALSITLIGRYYFEAPILPIYAVSLLAAFLSTPLRSVFYEMQRTQA